MKLFLVKSIFLTIAVVAAIFIIGAYDNNIYKKQKIDENILRIKALEKIDTLDILFFGSSHTYSGIDPTIFESAKYSAFNTAFSNGGIYFMKLGWENYKRYHKSLPKCVCIDINASTLTIHSDDFPHQPIHRYFTPAISNEELVSKFPLGLKEKIKDYCQLKYYAFNTAKEQIFNRPDSLNVNNSVREELLNRGFYSFKQRQFNDSATSDVIKVDSINHLNLRAVGFDNNRIKELYSFIDELQKSNVRVLILQMPDYRYASFFSKTYLEAFDNFLKRLKQDKNVTLVNKPEGFDNAALYRDMHHLTVVGAEKYSKWLLAYFETNHIIE